MRLQPVQAADFSWKLMGTGEEGEGGGGGEFPIPKYSVTFFFSGSNLQMIDDNSQVYGLSVLYINKN